MKLAINQAKAAAASGEVPIGAIIVSGGKIISKAYNQVELLHDVTAHAEILAITSAEQYLNAKYLSDCTLYITVEPCLMCAGALKWAQIDRIVYGTDDEKYGFMQFGKQVLHPKTKLSYGVCQQESAQLMIDFFKDKRRKLDQS